MVKQTEDYIAICQKLEAFGRAQKILEDEAKVARKDFKHYVSKQHPTNNPDSPGEMLQYEWHEHMKNKQNKTALQAQQAFTKKLANSRGVINPGRTKGGVK